jgi:hypothetical protein
MAHNPLLLIDNDIQIYYNELLRENTGEGVTPIPAHYLNEILALKIGQSLTMNLGASGTVHVKRIEPFNMVSFTSVPLFKVVGNEFNKKHHPALVGKYFLIPPSYCYTIPC